MYYWYETLFFPTKYLIVRQVLSKAMFENFGKLGIVHWRMGYSKEIKGVLHLLPQKASKLACFVLYLKIINIFLKNDICIL